MKPRETRDIKNKEGGRNMVLEKEMACFEGKRQELLSHAAGKFVLICGEKVIDTFPAKEDALKRGYEICGNGPFLVKRIEEYDTPIRFTSNLIQLRC